MSTISNDREIAKQIFDQMSDSDKAGFSETDENWIEGISYMLDEKSEWAWGNEEEIMFEIARLIRRQNQGFPV